MIEYDEDDEFEELIPIDSEEENWQHEIGLGKKLLLEADDISLGNTNIIDNINNVLIMADKVKTELRNTRELKRELFVTINKMEWNCVDILTSVLEKIKKAKED